MKIGILDLLGIIFIVLKLCGVIDWSWVWVLCPFWFEIIMGLLAWWLENERSVLRNIDVKSGGNDSVGGQKMTILELIVWIIVGMIVFFNGRDPSKLEYGLVWLSLIINICVKFFK